MRLPIGMIGRAQRAFWFLIGSAVGVKLIRTLVHAAGGGPMKLYMTTMKNIGLTLAADPTQNFIQRKMINQNS